MPERHMRGHNIVGFETGQMRIDLIDHDGTAYPILLIEDIESVDRFIASLTKVRDETKKMMESGKVTVMWTGK